MGLRFLRSKRLAGFIRKVEFGVGDNIGRVLDVASNAVNFLQDDDGNAGVGRASLGNIVI